MATLGKYCKAYSVNKFRLFSKWTEKPENTRKEKQQIDRKTLAFEIPVYEPVQLQASANQNKSGF